MNQVQIRRVNTADAGRARAFRLEMLADTPLAFITTLAEEAERPHATYARLITRCANGQQNAIFIADAGNRIVGQAGAVIHPQSKTTTMLFAVYVTPTFRGRGLLGGLIDAVAAWSRGAGRHTLELEVVTSNNRAWSAYRKLGFEPAGAPVSHPTYPVMTEQRLTRKV